MLVDHQNAEGILVLVAHRFPRRACLKINRCFRGSPAGRRRTAARRREGGLPPGRVTDG
jgi:hypothetical protein